MTDVAVSERRTKPIQDAIAGANWKQALQLCNKWSKKGETSERFLASLALKASVLLHQNDAAQHDKGVSEVLKLCRREPAVTDLDALHDLHDALKDLKLQAEEGPRLWGRAATAKPYDRNLLMTWLQRSVFEDNWLSAQKAAMALRKGFPQERKYEFWNIVMCFLVHEDLAVSEKERTMFGALSYRMLSKAATAVTEPAKASAIDKAIQSPEELNLLVKVYIKAGHAEEAVTLLQNPALGLRSRFAEQDSQLVLNLILSAYEAAGVDENVFEFCQALLEDDEYEAFGCLNDDRVWSILRQSISGSSNSELLTQVDSLLKDLVINHGRNRVLRRNMILIQCDKKNRNVGDKELLATCLEYYELFKQKSFCFEDLLGPLRRLDQSSVDAFFDAAMSDGNHAHTPPEKGMIQRLLNLKLLFSLKGSQSTTETVTLDIAHQATTIYMQSLEQKQLLPEACLLAATALMRSRNETATTSMTPARLLQAVTLLESCCRASEDYFPSSLMLIRLHLALGSISLAMMHFKRLSVKNMQWETIGHIITSRISKLHPQQYGQTTPTQDAAFNPYEALDLTLNVAENSHRLLTRGAMDGLKHDSYSNVIESVQMRSEMQNSLLRQITIIEERKMQRTRGVFGDTILPMKTLSLVAQMIRTVDNHVSLAEIPVPLVDKRDFQYFSVVDTLTDSAMFDSMGLPTQGKTWPHAMSVSELVFTHLQGELSSPSGVKWLAADQLWNPIQAASQLITNNQNTGLTEAERDQLWCHYAVGRAYVLSKTNDPGQLETNTKYVKDWLQQKLNQPRIQTQTVMDVEYPDCRYLHTSFSCLETLQLLALFCAASGPAKASTMPYGQWPIVQKFTADLRKLVPEIYSNVQNDAKRLKDGLNASGVLGKLIDGVSGRHDDTTAASIGKDIERLCDATALENTCGQLRESWEDALDGILAVKLNWLS